jgi:hypothetical protein
MWYHVGSIEAFPTERAERNMFACRQYGFYPGTQQFDVFPPLLRP